MSWINEARSNSRKVVVSPITGRDFTIRKLTNTEITDAGLSAIISVEAPKDAATSLLSMARQADQVIGAQTRYVLEHGVTIPKISYGTEDGLPDSTVHASWVAEDEKWLFLAVLDFSGVASEASRAELEKYAKNAHGSESLTASAAATGDSPTNS